MHLRDKNFVFRVMMCYCFVFDCIFMTTFITLAHGHIITYNYYYEKNILFFRLVPALISEIHFFSIVYVRYSHDIFFFFVHKSNVRFPRYCSKRKPPRVKCMKTCLKGFFVANDIFSRYIMPSVTQYFKNAIRNATL